VIRHSAPGGQWAWAWQTAEEHEFPSTETITAGQSSWPMSQVAAFTVPTMPQGRRIAFAGPGVW